MKQLANQLNHNREEISQAERNTRAAQWVCALENVLVTIRACCTF